MSCGIWDHEKLNAAILATPCPRVTCLAAPGQHCHDFRGEHGPHQRRLDTFWAAVKGHEAEYKEAAGAVRLPADRGQEGAVLE